jgi:hypothetical protein
MFSLLSFSLSMNLPVPSQPLGRGELVRPYNHALVGSSSVWGFVRNKRLSRVIPDPDCKSRKTGQRGQA